MMGAVDQLRAHIVERAVDIVERAADTTVRETQAAASRRSGELVAGINHTDVVSDGTMIGCEIRSEADYSAFQDSGTGLSGPRGALIVMPEGKLMKFYSDAAGHWMSLKESRGAPGRHFFVEPMPQRWHDALAGEI